MGEHGCRWSEYLAARVIRAVLREVLRAEVAHALRSGTYASVSAVKTFFKTFREVRAERKERTK